jgi:hypothetical protein
MSSIVNCSSVNGSDEAKVVEPVNSLRIVFVVEVCEVGHCYKRLYLFGEGDFLIRIFILRLEVSHRRFETTVGRDIPIYLTEPWVFFNLFYTLRT